MVDEFKQYRDYTERSAEQLAKEKYLASTKLANAVNTALAAEQPLLVTGEPGTGKTTLARSIQAQLGIANFFSLQARSDHQYRDFLYTFDQVERFYDAHAGNPVTDLTKYRKWVGLGDAIQSQQPAVVLLDEIDKAPRDLPNDLLDVIESRTFKVPETRETVSSSARLVIVITSNNERELPAPFLRRCVFHHLEFPRGEALQAILDTHFGRSVIEHLSAKVIERFEQLRARDLLKAPATSELITWMRVLVKAGVKEQELGDLEKLPHLGALLKNPQDLASVAR